MGGNGFERRRAIEMYAQAITAHRNGAGTGYDAHERALLLIGFAQGWDAFSDALDRLAASIHDLD